VSGQNFRPGRESFPGNPIDLSGRNRTKCEQGCERKKGAKGYHGQKFTGYARSAKACVQGNRNPIRQTIHNAGSRPTNPGLRGFYSCAHGRGRAITGQHDQEDLFDANSHAQAAEEEEKFLDHKESFSNSDRFAGKKIFDAQ
jgi:hypothetical protein